MTRAAFAAALALCAVAAPLFAQNRPTNAKGPTNDRLVWPAGEGAGLKKELGADPAYPRWR